jgi:nucleotide-binding universal stress UspA family protein
MSSSKQPIREAKMASGKSAETRKAKRIIWAVDPFTNEKEIHRSAAWCLKALVKSAPAEVEPVYVWPTAPTDAGASPDLGFLGALRKEGQDALSAALARVKIPGMLPLQILARNAQTVRDEARELVAYAKRSGADLIVVPTHGRTGVRRMLLGSFAETLSLHSDVPLITIHPNWRRAPDFKTILFPSDFSEDSKAAFRRVIGFASIRRSRVVLFHKIAAPIYPTLDAAFTAYQYQEQAIADEQAFNERAAKELVEEAKKVGVRVEVEFDKSRSGSVSDAILKRSKRLGSMVAMVAQSGAVSAILLGSTTRQVIRASEQPVWVIHAERKRAEKEAQTETFRPQIRSA